MRNTDEIATTSGSAAFARSRWNRGLMTTMPLVIAGAMTVTGLTGPLEPAAASPKKPERPRGQIRPAAAPAPAVAPSEVREAARPALPASHRVTAGDTVSSIAGRYGLSTASVLAMNGLGWKSLIFPGQVLKLGGQAAGAGSGTAATKPATAAVTTAGGSYTIRSGDTVSRIAARFGTTTKAVLDANGLKATSIIYPGQRIRIPASGGATATTGATGGSGSTGTSATSYTIRSGDTVTSIAKRFGVRVEALLAANGLKSSSIIYAGRTLRIPAKGGTTTTGTTSGTDVGSTVTPLSAEMASNARVIVAVGRQLGVSDRGIVIALAAAMQESSLRNIDHGDRDSLGLFQQRPSTGWGTRSQLLNPAHAARLFYGGPSNPNKGKTRGLLDIRGWESMSLTKAAQAVQISAHPTAYAKWEKSAAAWLAQLG
ncbi:LysM peptidoglycan-binding domain-containing protein [Homoserinibacter sp. YIM 151385]|uniref:LysM peptidoglycan-binding domain-containing protein n=1 Tax=Homoserinibacter sp. YIM 151385 TaxID=2985506 RepID=UPI0022F10CD8|nr:LysM peptidoglycan-binding domain-containing protein [Homoserinibacter sp. YIM 151385]WBU38751.1 LysM peptidoglycan-binding domain-containing protein [Homoserinibacter sp. YIM 151385]